MIVPVSSEKYDNLFKEATDFLRKNGTNIDDINSLNAYYGHMQKFYQAASKDPKGYKYIMMPLDSAGEETFDIDLNSRSITVPKTFAVVGGVQADQMAELIVFNVDRYFDYMDLANTIIYVQWQLPDEKATTGATEITIRDYETTPGKIRFAWPLHETVTAHSGIVRFSVRFFIFDKNNKLAYSLNTLESSLLIRPALDPTSNITAESVNSLFANAILDSQYTHTGKIPPVMPMFENPGMEMTIMPGYTPVSYADENAYAADSRNKFTKSDDNFIPSTGFVSGTQYYVEESDFVRYMTESAEAKQTRIAKLGADNKLVMRAQAIITDAGTLTYQWQFKPAGSTEWQNLPSENVKEVFIPAQLPYNMATQSHVLDFKERYFQIIDGEPQPYNGYEPPLNNAGVYDGSLLEMLTQYTIPAAEDSVQVVGTYAVVAKNTIDNDSKTAKERYSAYCYLPGPAPVEFDEVKGIYTLTESSDKKKSVVANVKKDSNNPDLQYIWFRSYESPEAAVNLAKTSTVSNIDNLDVNDFTPGWYAVKVESKLNRKKEYGAAPVAQVIYPTPTITSVEPAGDEHHFERGAGDTAVLKVQVNTDPPESLKDVTGVNTALYRNLSYEWYYKKSDTGSWKQITSSMVSESDTNKLVEKIDDNEGSITVRNIEDMTSYWYKCIVTNTLGKEKVTKELNPNKHFLVY